MQKSSRFVFDIIPFHGHMIRKIPLEEHVFFVCLFVLKDVKFPLMLDVYELCTAELQERMLPIRSKFKEMEDKKLEKQQQKVRVVAFLSFLLKITHFFKLSPVTHHVRCLCALGDEEA